MAFFLFAPIYVFMLVWISEIHMYINSWMYGTAQAPGYVINELIIEQQDRWR